MSSCAGNGNGVETEAGQDEGMYLSAYRRLSDQPAATVRFFDKDGEGERYTVYDGDARLAEKAIFATVKTYGSGAKRMECAYLNKATFETFVKELLLVRQYRVEIYVNEGGGKGKIEWVVHYKGSPGNLAQFEDLLFTNNEITVNNGVMGIRISTIERNKTVGLAHVNMNEWEINLLEFVDSDNLTNFETVLVQLSPKEAVIPFGSSQSEDLGVLKKILERHGVMINEKKSVEFDAKDICQDLSRLLKKKKGEAQSISADPEMEKTLAVSSLAGVIKYLELMAGETYLHQFIVKGFDFGLYVKMDASACRALHLNLNYLEQSSKNDVTLLSIIDKCRTAQGHRLLSQYLKQPLLSKEKLEERLDLVQILFEDVVLRQSLHDEHLRRVPDCQAIARKLLKNKASLQDCYRAYLFLVKLNKMIQDLEFHDSSLKHVLTSNFIEPLHSLKGDLATFTKMVETTLDLEMADKGSFIVRSDFDENFAELRRAMDEIEEEMGELTYEVAETLHLEANKHVKLESTAQHGYYFRVVIKDEKLIRHNKEFTIVHTTKAAVGFRNHELLRLSERYIKKRETYEKEQKGIVSEVLGVAAGYASCFEQLGHVMSALDVITSFAFIAANSPTPFIRPKLLPKGSGVLRYDALRHPCVETQSHVSFIPNDVHFQHDKQLFYIITGPNMGGKSTFLRSIGVATLLAHIGSFVPADYAEVSIVDAILARVGAGDSLTKGVSTFMAEMIETSFILKTATADSLVIIDELGRGTSTYDGFGLCWAISQHLAKKVRSYCCLATHFHELTSLADEVPTVVNYHVTAIADDTGLTMLYKIERGPCDRSFGINIASYVHFPMEVVEKAKHMARTLEDYAQEEDKEDSEAAVKRRKDNKTAGKQLMNEFLEKVKYLSKSHKSSVNDGTDLETAEEAFQSEVEVLLAEISEKAEDNPYLKHILQQPNK